jgi:hypothetical protein
MDCTWARGNNGCEGGEVDAALSELMNSSVLGGNPMPIAYESDYNYLGASGWCMNPSMFSPAGTVNQCWAIPKTTELVKQALFKFGPLAVSITVTESMLLYTDGPFYDETCSGAMGDLDHSVLLTGWTVINDVLLWEIKNSWSTHWGDNGYIYIQAQPQESNCGVTTDAIAVEVNKPGPG